MSKAIANQLTIKKSRLVLHFLYCSIILVFCIILVATDRWTDKENFTEYLTNIATAVSLVLGLVAIFYSFISNVGLSQSLGNIYRVAEEIEATRNTMGEFIRGSTELVKKSEESASEMRRVSSDVADEIKNLDKTLDAFRVENAELRTTLAPIPERIDQLSSRFSEATQAAPAAAPPLPQIKKSDDEIRAQTKAFERRSSVIGLAAAYALTLAHSAKKEVSVDQLSEAISPNTRYLQGFVVGLHSAGAVTAGGTISGDNLFPVEAVDSFLVAVTKTSILAELKRRQLKSERIDEWAAKLAKIEATFGSS